MSMPGISKMHGIWFRNDLQVTTKIWGFWIFRRMQLPSSIEDFMCDEFTLIAITQRVAPGCLLELFCLDTMNF
jgi:hypothetical protein